MLRIGILDLLVIYLLPLVLLGALAGLFFLVLTLVVKKDLGRLAFSEDVRHNIQIRKRAVGFGSVMQMMLFDSGVQAAFLYRVSRFLYYHRMRTLSAVLHKIGKYLTSVDLPPTAKVGPGVSFLHCCNIVIGPYVEIGSHVMFRPFVALRGWGTVRLEDDVKTGLQTCVMDCVTMGKGSESAPGAILTQDVPPYHIAMGVPAKRMVPRPESRLQGVVLDLDNVLLEPAPLFGRALAAALDRSGKPSGLKAVEREDLPPAKVLRKRLGGDAAALRESLRAYQETVREGMNAGLRLRSNSLELLDKLRERALRVALVSRQPDALAREIAERLGLASRLDFLCGADDFLDEWKPEPWILFRPMRELKIGVERVIYVAGSLLDLQTGIEGAVRVFWLASPDAKGPPRGLVNRYPDLASILREFSQPILPQTI